MNVLDANVVIALFKPGHTLHDAALEWWEGAAHVGEPFTMPDVVVTAFIRVVTNPRSYPIPATFDEAWAFAEALMAQPHHTQFVADRRILVEFATLSRDVRATRNLLTDAYIAACAAAYGATVVTFDRDFRKFDGVKVKELPV